MNIKKVKSQLTEESRRETRIRMRMAIVLSVVGVGFLIIILRAVDLHCLPNKDLKFIASKQYEAVLPQSGRRGKILDRSGKELAVSLPVRSIYADPKMVSSKEETANQISKILKLDEKDLLSKLKSPRRFVWLKRRVSEDEFAAVKDIKGIYAVEESKRYYPNNELASQVLGAVSYESEALSGVEQIYDRFLASKNNKAIYKRDARGKFYFAPVGFEEQDDVADIYLTIDKRIQFVAENALKKEVEASHAKSGTTIVMDIETGAILAMASMPSFDPNNYSKFDQSLWRTRAVTDMVEPGSTFKTLIVASAIDQGAVDPETKFDCENGIITVGNAQLHDSHPHGVLPVKDIIKVSSNIGAYKIASTVGKEKIYEGLKKFGIGNKTGLELQGEASGIVRSVDSWKPVNFATIAFGHGISVTPIQMVAAFSAVANGGKLMKPYIVDKIVNNQGVTIVHSVPTTVSQPITSLTSKTMVEMLERVVEEGGTGTRAKSSEYQVAGKTGTAQKVGEGTGRYMQGKYYASFIGFAPTNSPKLAVFVGIDEPVGAYYGGAIAAPVFKEIVEVALKYMAVPTSQSKVVVANNDFSKNADIASLEISSQKRVQRIDEGSYRIPDLHGTTMREALDAVGQANIKIKVEGSGIAFSQEPSGGSVIRDGGTLKISFKQPE